MKKIKYIIACILMLFTFISCNKNQDKFIIEGNYSNETLVFIDGDILQEKIESKDSFVLIIMLSSCSSCHQFKEQVINPYIQQSKATIYGIYSYNLDGQDNYANKPKYKTAPAITIYNQGKCIKTLNYDHKDKTFSSMEGFKEFMIKYIIEPKIVEVSEEVLDDKLSNEETFVLYIGWNKCGDCSLINDNVLQPYFLDNENKENIFYLETDKYRSKRPLQEPTLSENPTDEEIEAKENWDAWISFASKYNFVSYNNGKIPTIQYYENGIMKDMIVYLNDVKEEEKIIDSFYEELIGSSKTQEELIEFHNKKVVDFLNKYVK